ncbi:hypothetical protein ACXIUT_19515 [Achromobacter denitrificans]
MTEINSSLNDLIAQRDALTEKIAELKKGRSEAIKKIVAVMGRFAISVDEIQLALPNAAPASAPSTVAAKPPYTGKKRGRKPKGTPGHADLSGGSQSGVGGSGAGLGAADPAAGNPPASDLLQNANPSAAASPSAADGGASADAPNTSDPAFTDGAAHRDDAAGDAPTVPGSQAPLHDDDDSAAAQRPAQASDDEANPIPSAAPSAD